MSGASSATQCPRWCAWHVTYHGKVVTQCVELTISRSGFMACSTALNSRLLAIIGRMKSGALASMPMRGLCGVIALQISCPAMAAVLVEGCWAGNSSAEQLLGAFDAELEGAQVGEAFGGRHVDGDDLGAAGHDRADHHQVVFHVEGLEHVAVRVLEHSIVRPHTDLAAEEIAHPLAILGRDVRISEHRLSLSTHVAHLERRADVYAGPAERRHVGDDQVAAVHHFLVGLA